MAAGCPAKSPGTLEPRPIPQSEWVKILKQLHWTELDLLEMPAATTGDIQAMRHLEEARNRMANRDWTGTLESCHKALEAAVHDPKNATKRCAAHLTDTAQDALDLIVRKTKAFLTAGTTTTDTTKWDQPKHALVSY